MADPAVTRAGAEREAGENLADEALAARVMDSDRTAFAMLVERHLDRTVAVAQRILLRRAEAEDVAQDVFLKFWQSPHLFDADKARFSTWLYRVAVNKALDITRKKRPASLPTLLDAGFDIVDDAPSAFEQVSRNEQSSALAAAMSALPERQRAALVLSYHQDLSDADAASVLSVSVKAYESLLVRARRTLRDKMKRSLS